MLSGKPSHLKKCFQYLIKEWGEVELKRKAKESGFPEEYVDAILKYNTDDSNMTKEEAERIYNLPIEQKIQYYKDHS